ncbi:MAG: DUF3307 domain-containing protein [bacterium]
MEIFWGLIFSHFLADFTFQTNYIAKWRAENIRGRWVHVFIFLIITIIITFPSLGKTWFRFGSVSCAGWLCVISATLLHLAEDQFRAWCVKTQKLPDNIFFLLWDQFIHIMVIFFLAPRISLPYYISAEWLKIGTLFVIVTHCATILIYYFEKDIFGDAVTLVKGKYFAISERIMLFLCFFLQGWEWGIGVGAWTAYFLYRKLRNMNDRTWIDVCVSYIIAILAGFIARLLVF